MAAPIVHIFLALQALSGPLADKFNEQEFILGTSFPDIHYLRCISKNKTCFPGVSFEAIKNETNSFKAGMLFHTFVDEKRAQYIATHGIYNRLPKFRFIAQALKFAEDKIILSEFNVKPYRNYFDSICSQERGYVRSEYAQKWHTLLQQYFDIAAPSPTVSDEFFRVAKTKVPFYLWWIFITFYAKKMEQIVHDIVTDQSIRRLMLDFYENFSDQLL